MKIGNLTAKNNLVLAPMAGVTDMPFRTLTSEFGVGVVYSEMVSAKALCYHDKHTAELLRTNPDVLDSPLFGVQIFGREPEIMAKAATMIETADFIDINCGCPAPKIVKNGEGSALLKDPNLIGKIIGSVCKAVNKPVTVKIRSGWDDNTINAVEVAQIAEQSGASAIIVHPRTSKAQYSGHANWDIIGDVVTRVNIPVIGNGDIQYHSDAKRMLEHTNCDGIAIGRGAWGAPWIFEDILRHLNDEPHKTHTFQEIAHTAIKHFEMLVEFKGERIGMLEARKHACFYTKGFRGAAELRRKFIQVTTLQEIKDLFYSSLLII